MIFIKTLFHITIIVFLTILTQIGGLVYVVAWIVYRWISEKKRWKFLILFSVLYLVSTWLIVPYVAPLFGRKKVRNSDRLKPTNYATVLLNRHYVKPALNDLLQEVENDLRDTEIKLSYLDANFPFWDGFPLLPHRSHNDGKKIDLSLIYENQDGVISTKQKSISGYGVYEEPHVSEYNQIMRCLSKGYWQYDFPKYLTFGKINGELRFSEQGTRKLIRSLLKNPKLGKIFIEPHLKTRMRLNHAKIRYHGCKAVRHDDHIHIQL